MKLVNLTVTFALSILSFFASGAISAVTVLPRVVPPGASTPLFYLVASSADQGSNLLPLRMSGGTSDFASLAGRGPIGQFYFFQGRLTALDPSSNTNPSPYHPQISTILGSTGCSTYGPLGFIQQSSSNKCSRFDTFQLQSNTENGQLGARLVFNFIGGFYACGTGRDVWYKVSPEDGPSNCSPVILHTVPVVVA